MSRHARSTPRSRDRSSAPSYLRARARTLAPRRIWCHLCGEEIDKSLRWPHPLSATADHIVPVARGGSNTGAMAPAHKSCNERRGTSSLSEWDDRLARQRAAATTSPPTRRFRW